MKTEMENAVETLGTKGVAAETVALTETLLENLRTAAGFGEISYEVKKYITALNTDPAVLGDTDMMLLAVDCLKRHGKDVPYTQGLVRNLYDVHEVEMT